MLVDLVSAALNFPRLFVATRRQYKALLQVGRLERTFAGVIEAVTFTLNGQLSAARAE
jgi:hypothetical protein